MNKPKEKLQQIVNFRPAYHKVHKDPKKNFGVGAVTCEMVMKGEKGVVHFIFSTGMMLPKTYDWWKGKGLHLQTNKPDYMGYDVGYHSPVPMFQGHEVRWPTKMVKPKGYAKLSDRDKLLKTKFVKIGKKAPICEWLGKPCYCDGSALAAEKYMNVLLAKGSGEIWKMLKKEYFARFYP